jgi:hypothetical protein
LALVKLELATKAVISMTLHPVHLGSIASVERPFNVLLAHMVQQKACRIQTAVDNALQDTSVLLEAQNLHNSVA